MWAHSPKHLTILASVLTEHFNLKKRKKILNNYNVQLFLYFCLILLHNILFVTCFVKICLITNKNNGIYSPFWGKVNFFFLVNPLTADRGSL